MKRAILAALLAIVATSLFAQTYRVIKRNELGQDQAEDWSAVDNTQLPLPGVGSRGGVESKTCTSTDKLSAIGTDGVPVCSADEGGGGAAWGSITGTLSTQTDLQTALDGKEGAGTFSGVGACAANTWASTLVDNSAPTCTQPAFSNISGSVTDAQVPNNITVDLATLATTTTTANAGDSATAFFSAGTIEGARLPNPAVGTKGGVEAETCSGTDKVSAVNTDGTVTCSADETSAGGDAFPVGAVFISVVSTNPATLLGYGTWSAFGAGRVLVGIDAGQTEFDVVEETGGAKTHTLTAAEMPAHTHGEQRFPTTTGASSGFTADTSMSGTPTAVTQTTASAGSGGAHNNLQPYIVVYMWKRTS